MRESVGWIAREQAAVPSPCTMAVVSCHDVGGEHDDTRWRRIGIGVTYAPNHPGAAVKSGFGKVYIQHAARI